MKLIQYNIYFGDHHDTSIESRTENICKSLIEENADVICLQEVLQSMYELIVALLIESYPYVYPDPRTGLIVRYDSVIFSKHQIKKVIKHKFEITSMCRDLKLILIQNPDNDKIYICTTHFESEFKDSCMKKIYQYKRCADILERLHKSTKISIFLCADTNVCNSSEHVFNNVFSFSKNWRDAWIESGSDKTMELTFDSNTNPILISRYELIPHKQKYKARLDRILHISDLHCTEFKLLGTDPLIIMSDHYGVVCTFSKDKPDSRDDYIVPERQIVKKVKMSKMF